MSLNVAPALRATIADTSEITSLIQTYAGGPAIFTRRPIPDGAPVRFILINPDAAISDLDGLNASRPIVQRDIVVYGNQPDDYRDVEAVGYALRELFHRHPERIRPDGYHCAGVTVSGPNPAPTDNITQVARMVNLTIQLVKL